MTIEKRQLIRACWESPVFGDSYATCLAYADSELQIENLERAFLSSFTPIIIKGMPEVPRKVHDAYARALSFQTIGLYSNIGVELRDIDRLTKAYVCFGLLFWGDSFLDRGDSAMETALPILLDEFRTLPPLAIFTRREEEKAKRSNRRQPHFAGLPSVQHRLGALRMIARQIRSFSRPDDAFVLLHSRVFDILNHSLGVRRLSRRYQQNISDHFWERHVYAYVKHSILSMSIFGFIGLIYAMYRQDRPDLPSLAEIQEEQPLMRFIDGLANAAARIFDDAGDQEMDAGKTPPQVRFGDGLGDVPTRFMGDSGLQGDSPSVRSWVQINLFNMHNPTLIRAFFNFIGVMDEDVIRQALEAFQKETREGDSEALQLFVDLLRRQLKTMPDEILQRYDVFITLAKRCIETTYNNALGDEVFGF
jgi:hypothetical protein